MDEEEKIARHLWQRDRVSTFPPDDEEQWMGWLGYQTDARELIACGACLDMDRLVVKVRNGASA